MFSDRSWMIPKTPLPHIREYVSDLNAALREQGHKPLTRIQSEFLMFVLLGMLITQSLCWARLERVSGGRYQDGTLSKMFYHGLKCWEYLLTASALIVMRRFNITSGVLVLDDTDRGRSKNTTRIWGTHKTVYSLLGYLREIRSSLIGVQNQEGSKEQKNPKKYSEKGIFYSTSPTLTFNFRVVFKHGSIY